MAIGLSPVLPLGVDPRNGYALHQEMVPMIFQNLKMVVLTCPGERAMDPEFGVGLRKYLFEPDQPVVYADIEARIISQVRNYLPYLEIEEINFKSNGMGYNEMAPNYTNINIKFTIVPLERTENIEIDL